MILVADTSALIALATCQSLDLLEQLFHRVVVPETVYIEATQTDKPQAQPLKAYLHDKIQKVDLKNFVFLDGFADAGETEAMILYKQLQADKLLIDDRRGRNIAKLNHISTIGSLGILLAAKQKGIIAEISPLLKRLQNSEIYFSEQLFNTVLELADEISI
jgi:uncharacterized protein